MFKSWWHRINFVVKLPILIVVVPFFYVLVFSTLIYVHHYENYHQQQNLESARILASQQKNIHFILQHARDKLQIITKTPIVVQSVSWTNQRLASLNQSQKENTELKADVSKYINLTISEPTRQFIRQELKNDFTDFVITEQNGFNIWGDYMLNPFDQREASWWYEAITRGFWVGDFQRDYENGEIVLPMACALKNEDSDNIGVLKASFRLGNILLNQLPETLPPSYRMIMADQTILNHIILPGVGSDMSNDLTQIKQHLADQQNAALSLGEQPYTLYAQAVQFEGSPVTWHLGVLVPRDLIFSQGLLTGVILGTLVGLGLFSFIYLYINRNFIRPLHAIHAGVEDIANARYSARIDPQKAYELKPMANRLNHLFEALQNFAQSKLDVQSVRTHISRLLASIKAVEDKNYAVLLPVLDNEWGVVNSEFNMLIQNLAQRDSHYRKKLADLEAIWEEFRQSLDQAGHEWAMKEKYWLQSWEVSADEWKTTLKQVEKVADTLQNMQTELRVLRDVVYSISDDLQIIKYHIRELDEDVELTSAAHEKFNQFANRMKGLATESTSIAQRAALLPSTNGFATSVHKWANETVTAVVEVNQVSAELNHVLSHLIKDVEERPEFSRKSADTYKILEKNIETLTQLSEKINHFVTEIETRRGEILNKGEQYKRQFSSDVQGKIELIARDQLESFDSQISALREMR